MGVAKSRTWLSDFPFLTHSLTHMVGTERANFAEACAPWRQSLRTSCFVLCAVPAGRSVNACWLVEVQETNTVALSQFSEGLSKGLLVTWLTIMPCPCHQHDQRVELQAGGTLVITCLVRPFKRLLLGHLTWCQSKDGLTVVPLCPHFRHVTPRVFRRTQKWSPLLETQRPQGRYAPQCGGPKHGVCRAMHPSPWARGCAPQHGGVPQASPQDWCLNRLSTACLCVSDLLFPGCAVLGFHLEFKIETGQASLVICECVWMDLVAVIQSAVSQKGQSR